MMLRWKTRIALVTGASEGIGKAVCQKLVSHGMIVVGCARKVGIIEALKGELKDEEGTLFPIKCDLSKESEILSMFDVINKEFGRIDVCVNCAGIGKDAPLLSGSTDDWRQMLEVNVLAVCICTRECVKLMRENNIDDGHIFNINSMGGHRVKPSNPRIHFYSATKFAMTALGEGVRNELRAVKSNIRMTSISPGMVDTSFVDTMMKGKQIPGEQLFEPIKKLEAVDIADAVIYALEAPNHVSVHDILMRPTEQIA